MYQREKQRTEHAKLTFIRNIIFKWLKTNKNWFDFERSTSWIVFFFQKDINIPELGAKHILGMTIKSFS